MHGTACGSARDERVTAGGRRAGCAGVLPRHALRPHKWTNRPDLRPSFGRLDLQWLCKRGRIRRRRWVLARVLPGGWWWGLYLHRAGRLLHERASVWTALVASERGAVNNAPCCCLNANSSLRSDKPPQPGQHACCASNAAQIACPTRSRLGHECVQRCALWRPFLLAADESR